MPTIPIEKELARDIPIIKPDPRDWMGGKFFWINWKRSKATKKELCFQICTGFIGGRIAGLHEGKMDKHFTQKGYRDLNLGNLTRIVFMLKFVALVRF